MGKNRDTHDPETVLPEAISEEVENFNTKKSKSSNESEPKHLVSFGTGRKQVRKERREEKRKNKMAALKDWRERRQQKKKPRSRRTEETKGSLREEDDNGRKKRKPKQKKRKRSRTEEEEEEEQHGVDPDRAEEERLQKLLFNSSKKQKKGTSFDWDLEFGSDNDEDGLKYLLEGLNVLKKSVKKAKSKNAVLDVEEKEFHEEEPDDDHFSASEGTEDPGDTREGVVSEEVDSRGEETPGALNGSELDEGSSSSDGEDRNPGSMDKVRDHDNSKSNTQKYVPPNRRSGVDPGNSKQLLGRRLRSSFNRLTNENSQKLIQEISTLLDASLEKGLAWNEVVNVLAEVVLSSVRDGSGVGRINPFVAAHAGAVIYLHVNSNDAFGAKMVVHAARAWGQAVEAKNRASFGVQAFLLELFHGSLLPSTFLFDMIKQLSLELDEQIIELLLLLIRSTGPALRHSDPGALIDIVNHVKNAAELLDLNVLEDQSRVRVLLDLVYDVKNHKTEESRSSIRFVLPWMKGILQELSPLQVQLSNLYDDEFVSTRWWRANEINRRNIENRKMNEAGKERAGKGAALAKQLGFNTDFRREIFSAISTSADVKDAVQRLSKLKLRKQRCDDCAQVIIHCCASELQYNKFYSLLARRVCSEDREMLYAFRHGFGNAFRLMEEGSDGFKPTSTYLRNLSQMLGYLWGLGVLDLGVLKRAPDLTNCSDESATFFKLAFESALCPGGGEKITDAFQQLATGEGFKHRDSIRLPLILFLRAHFENSKDVATETKRKARHLIEILTSAEDT
ncbi:hypothetical protein NDN08_006683 [Rhodosorus marinus]|uniref:MI domain-containing protein n=1 Tax=Rhodosorus marinus TaxID=101924 RepID=A0AAV8UNQ1_9RHOD|nr:hypothetical protein NDN08_006683 [Rhodosorus marinus]